MAEWNGLPLDLYERVVDKALRKLTYRMEGVELGADMLPDFDVAAEHEAGTPPTECALAWLAAVEAGEAG
jgi:hypothetical protein